MPVGRNEYDLFVSHSTRVDLRDRELVDALVDALARRGVRAFLDRKDLQSGRPLLATLESVIRAIPNGLVVVNEAAGESGWVTLELGAMLRRRATGSMRVFALHLDTTCSVPPEIRPRDLIVPANRHDVAQLADQVTAVLRRGTS